MTNSYTSRIVQKENLYREAWVPGNDKREGRESFSTRRACLPVPVVGNGPTTITVGRYPDSLWPEPSLR